MPCIPWLSLTSQVAHDCAGAYPDFCSMKRLGALLLLLDGMPVHRRQLPSISSGFSNSLLVPIYSWVERGTVRVKCLAQEHNTMTWPGLEPGPLIPCNTLKSKSYSKKPLYRCKYRSIMTRSENQNEGTINFGICCYYLYYYYFILIDVLFMVCSLT